MNRLDSIETASLRRDHPPFRPGDTLRVHVRVKEGEKERTQVIEGVCIRRRGHGTAEVEIKSRGHVRRSRLYFLRELKGKKARLRSKIRDLSALVAPEVVEAGSAAEAAGPQAAAEPAPEAEATE